MNSIMIDAIYYYEDQSGENIPKIFRRIAISKVAIVTKLVEIVLEAYDLDDTEHYGYELCWQNESLFSEALESMPAFQKKQYNIANLFREDVMHGMPVPRLFIYSDIKYAFDLVPYQEVQRENILPEIIAKAGRLYHAL